MPRHTPLFDTHVALGARMIDFGGWDMPLHYGSQIDEHHQVRRDAGLFDVSHMLSLDLTGPRAADFLRHLLANDVARLNRDGTALYTCMLNERGGVIDDLIVYRLDTLRYRLVVNAATAAGNEHWIRSRNAAGAFGVEINARRDLAMIAVQGPRAREVLTTMRPYTVNTVNGLGRFEVVELPWALVARTGYTGEDGFELTVPAVTATGLWNELLKAGAKPCGLGARDTLRLEAGMNLYGSDMDDTVSPFECGLRWTVDLGPGRDFVGRTALEQAEPAVGQVGLRLLDKGVLRSHMRVRTAGGEGSVSSGTFSPTLGFSIALARVPLEGSRPPMPGTSVEVEVRDKWLSAVIVKPPFVRNGKSLLVPPPACG